MSKKDLQWVAAAIGVGILIYQLREQFYKAKEEQYKALEEQKRYARM